MKIGVFDSGVGGQAVADAIKFELPELDILVREDKAHVPYGSRKPEEILGFVVPIFQEMIENGCQVIVVACNTVTTTIIEDLRQKFTVPLVAIEPMVKPAAALTKSKIIAICATPTTLSSARYKTLKDDFAQGVAVIEPDCSDWASMIESKQIDQAKITHRIEEVLSQKADVIVLACTHFQWIEDEIKELASGKATVLQPTDATIAQLKRVLGRLQ
jgi:glutamate racemase